MMLQHLHEGFYSIDLLLYLLVLGKNCIENLYDCFKPEVKNEEPPYYDDKNRKDI